MKATKKQTYQRIVNEETVNLRVVPWISPEEWDQTIHTRTLLRVVADIGDIRSDERSLASGSRRRLQSRRRMSSLHTTS